MQIQFATILLTAAGVVVQAAPAGIVPDLKCLLVQVVLDILALYPSVTLYCSSLLDIPTITSTESTTSTAFSTTTVTTTTGTNIQTATAVTVTKTAAETITTCIQPAIQERAEVLTTTTSGRILQTFLPSAIDLGIPAALSTLDSSQVTIACSCLSIPTLSTTITQTVAVTLAATRILSVAAAIAVRPTTTVTVTSTSTKLACPIPSASSCANNQGLQWAVYSNDQSSNSGDGYSNFFPEDQKTSKPLFAGLTTRIGGINILNSDPMSFYGSNQRFPSEYFVLNHKGYLHAAAAGGTYSIAITNADDAAFVWLGPHAYGGWDKANADLVSGWNPDVGMRTGRTTVFLAQGEYLPIRVMYAQAQTLGAFSMSITAPEGSVVLDANGQKPFYIVQYSCDGVTAPPFPDWDSEV